MICYTRPQFTLAARRSAACLLLISTMLVARQAAGQQPTWTITGSLSTARVLHTSTLLANGKVLVTGGVSTASAELYDPATGTWSATGNLGTPRLNHLAVRLPNGKVLVAGGQSDQSGTTTINSAEVYDPDTGSWSASGNLTAARTHATMMLLPNGKVLVAGGDNGSGALNTAELYDPATGAWSSAGTMNAARSGHSATLLPTGKVLVSGGYSGTVFNPTTHSSTELYDPATGSWTPTGSLGTARAFLRAVLLPNGKVLGVGGINFTSQFTTTELYDPANGQWSATGSMLTPRDSSSTLTVLANGKVLVVGNVLGQQSAELYEPATGSWTATVNPHSTVRLNHRATLLLNGKVLISGGNGPLASAELFDSGTPASSIQLGSASFSVGENSVVADITVTRSGDTSGSATVDFATSDGSARQRTDYILNSGTLSFGPGETGKSFTVVIVDDLYVEGNETLNLTLSSPTGGALLVGQNAASLTIVDNDSTTANTNPLDDPQFFVREHYYDFLSRLPDSGGLAYWSFQISSCGSDPKCVDSRRVGVSAAFFIELEFQQTGYVVYRLYRAAYGTLAGAPSRANLLFSDFMPDRSKLVAGPQLPQSTIDFANRFVARVAFQQAYPDSMTAAAFVNKLFDTAGLIHQAERQAAIEALTNGSKTRAQVLLDLIEISEFKTREHNPAFVLMQYFGYLRRDPDQGGYDFWLSILNNIQPNNFRGMVCAFITSPEYQERFSLVISRSDQLCANID